MCISEIDVNPRGDRWAEFSPSDQCEMFGVILICNYLFPYLAIHMGKGAEFFFLINFLFMSDHNNN